MYFCSLTVLDSWACRDCTTCLLACCFFKLMDVCGSHDVLFIIIERYYGC